MAIFVNYYPCSYGDSLVAMFSGQQIQRKNNLIKAVNSEFKLPDFYQQNPVAQQHCLNNLDNGIYSCHRQNQFDFMSHQVISVIVDIDNFLATRFKKIHMEQMGKTFSNPVIVKSEKKYTVEQLVNLDYSSWGKKNIFPSDIKMPLSIVYNNTALKKFCTEYNLIFNQAQVDEIVADIKRYKT